MVISVLNLIFFIIISLVIPTIVYFYCILLRDVQKLVLKREGRACGESRFYEFPNL